LLDASIDFSALEKIRETISAHPRVVKIKDLRARSAGSVIFLTAEVILRCPGFKDAHAITEELERAIKEAVPQIERVTIHYEPEEREYLLVVAPLEDLKGTLSDHFGGAPYLAFLKIERERGGILEKSIAVNPYRHEEKGRGMKLAKLLVDKGVHLVFSRENIKDKGPAYLLDSAGIQYRQVTCSTLEELLEGFSPNPGENRGMGQ